MQRRLKFLSRALRVGLACAAALSLAACGPGERAADGTYASSGQVAALGATSADHYAASRFAEQATFGPTAALVQELRAKGFAKWIDEQLALPASQVDPSILEANLKIDPAPEADRNASRAAFPNLALQAPDQLRVRVAWSLSQFIVVSENKVSNYAAMHWTNLLLAHGLGNYSDLLYRVSTNPAMGFFLDNSQNRPKSAECMHCAPNENYARELMQLFSLGVVKLNPDGTTVRDAKGQAVETYTQRDVEELARALTGWRMDPSPPNQPTRNFGNFQKPMIPSTWAPERDAGAKVVLGRQFPAGQSQDKDLRDAIDLLMQHPNIGPFVAQRMIQHLVKSNPSPQYISRMSAVFRNNGGGVAGDMKALVKAILLDPEARAGDMPSASSTGGKLREPFLHATGLWRGLGCRTFPSNLRWGVQLPSLQQPFNAESVFSFYAPTDRAPGSNLLAPEQRLVNATELNNRLTRAHGLLWDDIAKKDSGDALKAAGCATDTLASLFSTSQDAYIQWVSDRYFRGAMPPLLRGQMKTLIGTGAWNTRVPESGPLRVLDFALGTPYYGVMK